MADVRVQYETDPYIYHKQITIFGENAKKKLENNNLHILWQYREIKLVYGTVPCMMAVQSIL